MTTTTSEPVLTKEKLARRENRSMWRYRELLPVEETTPDTASASGLEPPV